MRRLERKDFCDELKLGASRGFAELVPNTFKSVADAQLSLSEARADFARLQQEGAAHGPLRTAECVVFGCEEGLVLAQAQAEGLSGSLQQRYKHAEVQVFQIGDTFVASFPGEQFVEYSLELKRAAPGRAFVISLANGELQGYIVTPEAAGQQSYEASFAMFAPESGRRLVDAALKLMRKATG